jgi:hypothetical protein
MGTTVAIGRGFLRSGFLRHFSRDSKRPSFNDAYLWIQVYVNAAESPLHRSAVVGMKRPTKKASIERLLRSGWLGQQDGGLVVPTEKRALAMAGEPTWLWFIPMRFGWLSVPARVSLMLIDESAYGFKRGLAVLTLAKRIGVSKKTMTAVLRELRADAQIITTGEVPRAARHLDTYRGVDGWLKTQQRHDGYLRGPSRSVPFVPPPRSVCAPTPFGLDPPTVRFVPHSGSLDHFEESLRDPTEETRSVPVEGSPEPSPSASVEADLPREESRLTLLTRVALATDPCRDSSSALEPAVARNCLGAKRSLYEGLTPGGFLAFLMALEAREVRPFMLFYKAGGLEAIAQQSQQTLDDLFRSDEGRDMDPGPIGDFFWEGMLFMEKYGLARPLRQAMAAELEARTETDGWVESRHPFMISPDEVQPDVFIGPLQPWEEPHRDLLAYFGTHLPNVRGYSELIEDRDRGIDDGPVDFDALAEYWQ